MELNNGKIITIKRVAGSDRGTFGVALDDGEPFCVTCELPWKDNQVNVSCIPTGVYEATRVDSPRFGNTFEVKNVEGRTHILFHKGNFALRDSRGCILLGESYNPGDTVGSSRNAFNEFLDRTKDYDNFLLQLTEV